MPIVDLQSPALDSGGDTPKGFAVTPGKSDVDHGSETPDFMTGVGAVFRQSNPLASFLSAEDRASSPVQEPGFNAWDTIKGTPYEQHWPSFVDVRNSAAADNMKRKIDRENADRKIVDALPFYESFPLGIAAGLLDPSTMLPGGAFVKGARGGFSIARSAALTAGGAGLQAGVEEAALHSSQETRTLGESALNVGASVVLGGLLGAGGAKLLSPSEWDGAVRSLDRELAAVPDMGGATSAGAAAVRPVEREANAIAGRAASATAKVSGDLNPLLRIVQSPSAEARQIGTQLFENSLYLKKNFEGVASEPAVETLMKEWNGGLARSIQGTNDAFAEYRKSGGTLGRDEFRQAVGQAMRRGDESPDPFVTKVAKSWRSQVFDPLKEAAIKAGLLPEDVSVDTAASYFSRMWNRNKLIAREGEFKQIVRDWVHGNTDTWRASFDAETVKGAAKLKDEKLAEYQAKRAALREERFDYASPRDVENDIANEVFNTLTGKGAESVRPEFITVKARGPLKERTFNIPDYLVENFLEHDVELVGRRYARVMGADVELANKFGSPDMADQLQKIRDDFANLRSGVSDEKMLTKLGKEEKANIRDLEALRDLLRGTRQVSPIEQNYASLTRSLNHVNYIRSMGEVVLASLTDAIRPAMVHGLSAYMSGINQLATNIGAVKLSVAEAQLAGNVAERVLGHRLATISELIDPYSSRGPIEAFLENMTNVASKWNGIRLWTDGMKSIASVMTQNRILKGVENFGSVKAKEKAYLAYLGIDESMAGRISQQMADHGEILDGVRIANTKEWTDPVAVRTYRAAINKDVDSIIVQKSVADVPLFATTPTGRMLLQFKSFSLASHQRILLRGLQEDQSRFIGGLIAMTAMGMFMTYAKAISGNRPELAERALKNPGWWIGEGLDRSGVLSVPMEIANAFEKPSGFNFLKTPLRAFDSGSGGQSQKIQNRSALGAIAGPTAGLIDDASSVMGIPSKMIHGEDVSQGQKRAAVRLLPFNNYAGVRQFIDYLVVPPQH